MMATHQILAAKPMLSPPPVERYPPPPVSARIFSITIAVLAFLLAAPAFGDDLDEDALLQELQRSNAALNREIAHKHALVEEQERQRQTAIADALRKAAEAQTAGHLVQPREGSALAHYQRAVELDPGNQEALTGLNGIFDLLLVRYRERFQRGELQEAGLLLEQAALVFPDSERLRSARQEHGRVVAKREKERRARIPTLADTNALIEKHGKRRLIDFIRGRRAGAVSVIRGGSVSSYLGPPQESMVIPETIKRDFEILKLTVGELEDALQ